MMNFLEKMRKRKKMLKAFLEFLSSERKDQRRRKESNDDS